MAKSPDRTVEDDMIARWLDRVGFGNYAANFADNRIDVDTLHELTNDDLKELGILPLGDRKKLLRAIAELRGETLSDLDLSPPRPHRAPPYDVPTHLAKRILDQRAGLEGELKQVTVLFADIKGSLALIRGVDPEEASVMFDKVVGSMIHAIHQFEGTVNQVQGDGLMAIFGAPIAHEDHAARACYAALAMQEAVQASFSSSEQGQSIQIRVGLNSGEVVIRSINTDFSMSYDAVGTTVHLASRMESCAPPNEIFLTADTLRLAEGFVEVEPQGPVPIKGFPNPIEAFALRHPKARTRWQATLARGLRSFVGREAALESLNRALNLAGSGTGQLAAIVGEAGIGKSRLVHEFIQSIEGSDWQVLAGSSVSYGKATTWLPVIDLLRDYLDVASTDNAQRTQEKIGATLTRLAPHLEAEGSAIAALLDVPFDDQIWHGLGALQQRRRILNALQAIIRQESQRKPLVLVFEDLHWIDPETQSLLDELVESLPTSRLLLLVNYRPEYKHSWSNRSYYSQLHLDPLIPSSAEHLLDDLLGSEPALDALRHSLTDMAKGNPLFLEESVRALIELGSLTGNPGAYQLADTHTALNLPASIQAIIAERIDRLAPDDKHLLRSASVIGTNVPLALLRNIVEVTDSELQRGVRALQEAEFIYQTHLFPEQEYMFKHAHTHEVAYRGLLQTQRRALHLKVAEAIQELYPERRVEMAERLGVHLEEGEQWKQAAEAYLLAARKGKGKFTYPPAKDYAQKALALAQKDTAWPDLQVQALTLLGDLASLTGDLDQANNHYDTALIQADAQAKPAIANRVHHRRFVSREAAKLAYYDHGSSSETIVFVQPNAYRIASFQPVVEALCQEFRIITIDPRGTGASDSTPDNYPIRERTEDIRAVIEDLDCGPVVGVGLSQGGKQLLRLAWTYPKLLKQVVTVGTTSGPPQGWPKRAVAQRHAIIQGDFSAIEEFVREFAYRIYPEPEASDLANAYIQGTLSLPRKVFQGFLVAGFADQDADIAPFLADIETATLVMHGTEDQQAPFTSKGAANDLVAQMPNAELYVFQDKGHQPYLTATQEFADVLRRFIRTGNATG